MLGIWKKNSDKSAEAGNDMPQGQHNLRSIMNLLSVRMALSIVALVLISVGIFWTAGTQKSLDGARLTDTTPCQFQKADQPLHVAFCDSFSRPLPTAGNRSGDLNAQVWGVSRITANTNATQGMYNEFVPVAMQKCGVTVTVLPPNDVTICNGQIVEAVNDGESQTVLAMYPKRPFDIAGRTGTVTFDVSANSEGPHAAWPTFVYTDLPVPAPYSTASGIMTSARNSFGFTIAADCNAPDNQFCDNCPNNNQTSVDTMFVTRASKLSDLNFRRLGCITRPSSPLQLNHFEVRVASSQVQVWASDPGSTALKLIAQADNANLPLTRGLVWMEDTHYNADKFNHQRTHTFGWDNLGFDGPVLPRDLATDAPDNTHTNGANKDLGWPLSSAPTVQVQGIYNVDKASAAVVTFNWLAADQTVPSVSVNGNAPIASIWPFSGDTFVWRTIAVPVPLSQIKAGTNTVTFRGSGPNVQFSVIANVDIILVGAGGVPTCYDPSNCAGTPLSGGYTSSTGSGISSTGGSSTGSTGGASGGSSGGEGQTPSPTPTPTPAPTGTKLGLLTVGTVPDNGDTNCINGSRITTGSTAAQLKSISVYVPAVEASPQNQYSLALYSNDTDNHPLKLLAQSATSTLTPTAWNTLPVTASLDPNTSYWLMYFTNGDNNMPYNNTGEVVGSWTCPGDFGSGAFPASLDSNHTTGKWQYSIYATMQ